MLLSARGSRVSRCSLRLKSPALWPTLLTCLLLGLRPSQGHLTVCRQPWGCLPEVPTLR